ncbi:MAG: hypothetical protein N2594_06120 [Clostridiales bacterium]|nr:hypothetical protein [Clostridiales bacterium]
MLIVCLLIISTFIFFEVLRYKLHEKQTKICLLLVELCLLITFAITYYISTLPIYVVVK